MGGICGGTLRKIFFGSKHRVNITCIVLDSMQVVPMIKQINELDFFFCSHKGLIEFRDFNNLDQIIYTLTVAPRKPTRLFQVSPSVLLYYCRANAEQGEIHWLDCEALPPRVIKHKNIIHLPKDMWWDMCFVQGPNKNLVVATADGPEGIHAYNADTNSLEWKKEIDGMEKAGIAADGHGHLFVFDKENKCVHMLSVADGQYKGCLIKEGEQDIGRPCWGVWSEETSSLIVAHAKGSKRFISVVRVQ